MTRSGRIVKTSATGEATEMRAVVLLSIFSLAGCAGGEDPVPAVEMYQPCDFDAECVREADLCNRIEIGPGPQFHIGAICTVECTASDQCPDNGVCTSKVPGGVAEVSCYQRCTSDEECPNLYSCVSRGTEDEGDVTICLPLCVTGGQNGC